MFSKKFVAATRRVSDYRSPVPAPLMRRSFTVDDSLKAAKLTITGLGFYELYCNGQRITKSLLAPYISALDDLIYYDVYDLTSMLVPGKNTLGIWLGNGLMDCFGGHIWDFDKAPWRGSPRTAFALELEDGSGRRILEADEQVKTHDSPIDFNDLRSGEHYDARKEIPGWATAEYDDSGWQPAIPVEAPRGVCRVGMHKPIVVEREIRPVSVRWGKVTHPPVPTKDIQAWKIQAPEDERGWEGWIYDFGENNAGLCTLRIKGKPGQKVILQFAELMDRDGGLDLRTMAFLPENYDQRDIYILRGDENGEEYTPKFTYHGFRYCLVMGLEPEQATADALTMKIMHGDFEKMSAFSCSNPLIDKLYEATQRSNLSNMYYFPTDCPHREKNGWTGDASLSAEQFMLNWRFDDSLREWLGNIRMAQNREGALPGIVPTGGWGFEWGNGPAWDSALFELPFALYKYRGNTDVIRENANAMVHYLDYVFARRDEKGLIHIGLGDWLEAESEDAEKCSSPLAFTDSVYTLNNCRRAETMLRAVGMEERANYAQALGDQLRESIRAQLIDFETMTVAGNCQTSQAMAVYYDVLEDSEKPRAVQKLVELLRENQERLKVGILGARVMFEVLSDYGYVDLACRTAFDPVFPSYGYWVANGATALPESFHPFEEKQDSHNHHFFGNMTTFMLKHLGGIDVNPGCDDPAHIRIAPHFPDALDFVRCSHNTVCGWLETSWERSGDEIILQVRVPQGVYGDVKAPIGWKTERPNVPLTTGTFRFTRA